MLRLDEEQNVDLYVQADTAYLHQQRTWELRGRVRIRNVQGTKFNTEELFWDLNKHEMWNHAYMTIITPERTLEGTEFRSNEQMTRYSVANSKGDFPMSDAEGGSPTPTDSTINANTPAQSHTVPSTQPIGTQAHSPLKPRNPNAAPVKLLAPAPTKYDLHTRLDGMPKKTNVCHGDFNPTNIIITKDNIPYILDWSHVTQGSAAADAARTYLLFHLNRGKQEADKYLKLFCEKSGIKIRKIQRWMPIVAASQSVKGNEDERQFLLSWVDVADYY